MSENMRRRLSIAKELATWADAIPALLRKIDVVLELSYLTETQTLDIELISVRVGMVFMSIRKATDTDESYDRLIASTDRLREEIVAADAALDSLLKPSVSS
jgi:hypothetical protein